MTRKEGVRLRCQTRFGLAKLLGLFAFLWLAAGCEWGTNAEEPAQSAVPQPAPVGTIDKLVDNRQVYDKDEPDSLVHLYITVSEHNLTAEHPMKWSDLNRIANAAEIDDDQKMDILIREGDENGPASGMFGYGTTKPNATIKLRGKSTVRASQKSYKVELSDSAGYWRDQSTINLVKHAYDFTRLRNKLSFDYFKMIPNMTSLRTQFVQLHVKDLTAGSDRFEDYGLYTQIEQPNKSFLRVHGLDPYGQLYKASMFEFFRYEQALKTTDQPGYDKAAFESVLEIKGSNDHAKLLRMLDEVNDLSLDFDEVFDRYFDRDNFMTWMAANILMDNVDTNSQNFFLYSPLNSQKWFFLPWDYDGGWDSYGTFEDDSLVRKPWQRGIHNYWGVVLQNRLFKNPENVEQLKAKVRELSAIINPENTRMMIETYKPIVSSFIRREPDVRYLPGPAQLHEKELERMIRLPVVNEQKFLESLEFPMPFYMDEVVSENGKTRFSWGHSYDLQGEELNYEFQLAKEPSFARPIAVKRSLTGTSVEIEALQKGKYYWRVTVQDKSGHQMTAFDSYTDEDGNEYSGVREFYVE